MQAVRPVVRSLIARNVPAGLASRSYHGGHGPQQTLNDLPMPQGDFYEHYNKQQSKNNAILVAGVVIFAATVGIVKSSGLIHLNFTRPDTYE